MSIDLGAIAKSPAALIGGTAVFGVIVAAWSQVKTYFSYMWGLAVIKVEITGSELNVAIYGMLRDEFKKMSFNSKSVYGLQEYVRPEKRNQLIAWVLPGETSAIWRKGWRFLSIGTEKNEYGNHGLVLSYLRGTFDFKQFISRAIEKHNSENKQKDWKKGERFRIIKRSGFIGADKKDRNSGEGLKDAVAPNAPTSGDSLFKTATPITWKLEDLGQPKKDSALNDLYYRDNVKEMIKEAFLWRDSEEWFKAHGVPWKRGVMMHSPPGCGKSALVRALAQELNMPIVAFDLSTMSNNDFSSAWDTAIDYAPCIALFEDIDAVFEGRKNIAATGDQQGLSFDFFLNVIDGVQNSDGVFKIVTTNNIEKIDPALGNPSNGDEMSTRPGRIDRVVYLDYLDKDGKEKMAQRILGDFSRDKWEDLLTKSETDTGAQFQERCCRLALHLFWQEKNRNSSV
jgi:hypothetical protein